MKIVVDYSNVGQDVKTISIVDAAYISCYKIEIIFDDAVVKIVDFKSFLARSIHPSLSKYIDKDLFQNFKIQDGNLIWNDYDMIFPVWDLYNGEIK